MKAIITGGAGFIGSHLADALIAAGDRVLIIDNFRTGRVNNVQPALSAGAELVELDICDQEPLRRAVDAFRPEVIFHFAAHVDVRSSALVPMFDASSNIVGSINIMAAAVDYKIRRIVNASTGGAIYGDATVIPTPEVEPARPICPYGLSKLAAETYAQWFSRTHDLDVVTLRFGNVYGPRQDPANGAVIARFCDQVIQDAEIEIFGTGTATRDYVHVADAVAASLEVGHRERLAHSVYNVSSGRETSVSQLARMVAEAAGRVPETMNVNIQPARPGEVSRSCLDISRATREKVIRIPTPLPAGISATLEWGRAERRRRLNGPP